MNIIGKKYIFLTVSGILVIAGLVCVLIFGLKQGIDFSGGSLWELRFTEKTISRDDLSGVLDAVIIPQEKNGSFLIRLKELSEAGRKSLLSELSEKFGAVEELQFQSIGPTVGGELRRKSFLAFGLVLLAISLYVAFAFRKVSKPVNSWKYGIIALITLFHDALIPTGLFAVLGKLFSAEVDTNFVVAILVVMGFSIHDTIVVFDRIRENLRVQKSGIENFDSLVNRSVNETMARSINTSLTLVLTLLALYFIGPATLKYFNLVILVGVLVGTYSSIFIASPLLTLWRKK